VKAKDVKVDPHKDLYAVLGVSPGATQEEIRRAHRRLARRFHPDGGAEAASSTRFYELQEAYQVLSDPMHRRAYDWQRLERGFGPQAMLGWAVMTSREQLPAIDGEQMLYLLLEIRSSGEGKDRQLPLNLCLVIDRSTSMQKERLDYVKEAAHRIVDELGDQDVLGIVSFSDRADVLIPSKRVDDRTRLHAHISSIWAGGGTEILSGLTAGLEQLRRFHRDDVISHLIILTDGRTYGDEDQSIAEARRAGLEGIGISALGIGEDWNDAFMDELVRQANGVCSYIAFPQQVRDVLQEHVRRLGGLFARDVKLTPRLTDHVQLEGVFRTSPYIERLSLQETMSLGGLRAGEPMRVLVEAVVARLTPGQHRLLQLELTAEVLAPRRRERLLFDLVMDVVNGPLEVQVPAPIVNTLGRLSVFRMQERAWQALESGEREEAQRRLEAVATRLLNMGEKELAHMALLEAGRVAQGGHVSDRGHKTIKYGTRGLGVRDRRVV